MAFPTTLDSTKIDVLIDVVLSRGNHTLADAAEAAYDVGGYALGRLVGQDPNKPVLEVRSTTKKTATGNAGETCPEDPKDQAKLLEFVKMECCDHKSHEEKSEEQGETPKKSRKTTANVNAEGTPIPWALILQLAMQIIESFTKK